MSYVTRASDHETAVGSIFACFTLNLSNISNVCIDFVSYTIAIYEHVHICALIQADENGLFGCSVGWLVTLDLCVCVCAILCIELFASRFFSIVIHF